MDIHTETLVPLKLAKRYLADPVKLDTLRHWCTLGVKNRYTGERIVLESVREGHRLFTSAEAIDRFRTRCSART